MVKPKREISPNEPKIEIEAASKGEWKSLGGGDRDQWDDRLLGTKALIH